MFTYVSTKDKILRLGKELMLKRGYNAFSFSDISVPLGIKNAAIHYHYPTKEKLGIDILLREQELFKKWKASPHLDELGYEGKLDRFFEIYQESLDLELSICMVGSVATHYTTIPGRMRQELEVLVSDMTNWLVCLLEDGQQAGVFQFKGESNAMAYTIVSSMAGSLQLSRVKGATFFYSVRSNIKVLLGISSD